MAVTYFVRMRAQEGREEAVRDLLLSNVELDMIQKTGQKCTAVRRVLVPEALVEDVTRDLVASLERIQVGDPASRETRMGPLASEAQLRDVRAGIEKL